MMGKKNSDFGKENNKNKEDINLSKRVIPTKNNEEENTFVEIVKTVVMAVFLSIGIRTFIAEARYIPSSSMEPTLLINDRLIIEKVGYHFNEPKRGDVVVFSATKALQEQGYNEDFIKRIIGIPGDTVSISQGKVYVNGQVLRENYIKDAPDYNFPEVTVPTGQYLVLGDNRNNSYDSHYWGFVPKENIIGRASVKFWPPQRMGSINEKPVSAEETNPQP